MRPKHWHKYGNVNNLWKSRTVGAGSKLFLNVKSYCRKSQHQHLSWGAAPAIVRASLPETVHGSGRPAVGRPCAFVIPLPAVCLGLPPEHPQPHCANTRGLAVNRLCNGTMPPSCASKGLHFYPQKLWITRGYGCPEAPKCASAKALLTLPKNMAIIVIFI